ncbi:hypothetical protein M422DRAFT_266663 [Sphaerobolus stellatus SS14]|uniref:Uncharacterized protein n=1 Tax=Sphaerobolus stellatus (strain SS14) TaxID=990650 RepID=A0A0C9V2A9_SPHS4|nr:hypothetical protein M422DRAFT_266663 [Sphaerobolus stellatus SS14]
MKIEPCLKKISVPAVFLKFDWDCFPGSLGFFVVVFFYSCALLNIYPVLSWLVITLDVFNSIIERDIEVICKEKSFNTCVGCYGSWTRYIGILFGRGYTLNNLGGLATGQEKICMIYTAGGYAHIVFMYGYILQGWPLKEFKAPTVIGSVHDFQTLELVLEAGECRWEEATQEDLDKYAGIQSAEH